MEFTTDINLGDYAKYNHITVKYLGVRGAGGTFKKGLIAGLFGGCIGVFLINGFGGLPFSINYVYCVTITLLVSCLALILYTKYTAVKIRPRENGTILGKHTFTFMEDKLVRLVGPHQYISPYSSLLQIIETDHLLFLYIDNVVAYLINKDTLSSEYERDDIIRNIKSKCSTHCEVKTV